MSAPVFLAAPGDLDGLCVGDVYWLSGTEGHHAAAVQRLGPGEKVDVVDGAGVRLVGTVGTVGDPRSAERNTLTVEVTDIVHEPADDPVLVLVQALAKGDRDDRAVEAATEAGVDRVVPWQAQRCVVVWRGPRAAKSQASWQATVRAAAKQSRRSWVPAVTDAVDLSALTTLVTATCSAGGAAVVLDPQGSVPLAEAPLPASGEILVVVGPEGGITPQELDTLTAAGAVTCRLGPHVLRTSTAGPLALALLSQRLGRWT